MNQTAAEIRKKRIIFTVGFIILTLVSYYVNEKVIMPHYSAYLRQAYLVQKLAIAGLYVWFGYSMGINKQTVWFMGLLAILPIVSWIALLYLLFKSGQMLLEAKNGPKDKSKGVSPRGTKENQSGKQKVSRAKSKKK